MSEQQDLSDRDKFRKMMTTFRHNRNLGFVSKEKWLKDIEKSGDYSCLEIIPFDPKTGIVYLKERNDPKAVGGEKEWEGKLHIPGLTNAVIIKGDQAPLILLKKEILKDDENVEGVSEDLKFLTQVKYPEPERNTVANTLILTLPIDPKMLQPDFKPVTKDSLSDVIDQHKLILEAYWNGNVPIMMDTRKI